MVIRPIAQSNDRAIPSSPTAIIINTFLLVLITVSYKIRELDNSSQSPIVSGFKFSTAGGPKFLIIIIVVIIAATAGGYWYWSKSKQAPPLEEAPTLGSEIFDKTQNQLEGQVPDANPFKDQKNPLDSIYKNPFE